MQPIDKVITLLKEQQPKGVKSGNWAKLTFKVNTTEEGTTIRIKSMKIGFVFDTKGNFEGMFNWKE